MSDSRGTGLFKAKLNHSQKVIPEYIKLEVKGRGQYGRLTRKKTHNFIFHVLHFLKINICHSFFNRGGKTESYTYIDLSQNLQSKNRKGRIHLVNMKLSTFWRCNQVPCDPKWIQGGRTHSPGPMKIEKEIWLKQIFWNGI